MVSLFVPHLQVEFDYIAGLEVEIGVNFDVKQIAHFLTQGFRWDPTSNQIASVHVGIGIDAGIQAGADLSFALGYHTSRCDGVDGFGWGFSAEYGGGVGMGAAIAYPLPGDGLPNQITVETSASAKLELSVFVGHGVIVGYFDKGKFLLLNTDSDYI